MSKFGAEATAQLNGMGLPASAELATMGGKGNSMLDVLDKFRRGKGAAAGGPRGVLAGIPPAKPFIRSDFADVILRDGCGSQGLRDLRYTPTAGYLLYT